MSDPLLRARDDEVEGAMWVILSERYEAIAEKTEHAMAVPGNRPWETYSIQREADG